MSRFDQLYRKLIVTKFFTRGWGQPENLKKIFDFRKVLGNRDACYKLVPPDYPVTIDKDELQGDVRILEGHFVSPFKKCVPGLMPKETEIARFQMVLPKEWKSHHKPVCLQLAGTGDHYYWRRRTVVARPLLKESGIASIILESPYYGLRKPKRQLRSSLHYTCDLFVMGGALMLESLVLFNWCERHGFGPLGVTGISMGGFMASLAASVYPKPISLIPCLSWTTASTVFTKGVMSESIPWKVLENQYSVDTVYADEIKHTLVSPEQVLGSTYNMGHEFVKTYSDKLEDLKLNQSPAEMENILKERNSHSFNDHGEKMDVQADIDSMEDYLVKKSGCKGDNETVGKFTIDRKSLKDNALDFMRGVMDECTHLGNFSIPVDPSLIIIVAANHDAYVPRTNVISLEQLWPGSQVRYIDSGHINAFLFHNVQFRHAIADSFTEQIKRYHS
ncbi:Protein ABHD18 [Mytilus coruscus]|uniref:Protein ABHD18 n=1 Tax=Mytilus coruscus TaxID=42192 RepID=A0A6J8ESD6_MYTCO|nr:Protein ABHD18 [Mytilus coruscus]